MRLSDYISDNLEKILQEWENFAASIAPPDTKMPSDELRDHAKAMLQAIAEDLRNSQTSEQQEEKSKGHGNHGPADSVGSEHGADRLKSNFTIELLVAEYRALRASVLRLWTRDNELTLDSDLEDVTRFNEAIDQSLAASVGRFAQESRKALDAERMRRDEFLAMLAQSEERLHRALQPQNVGVIFFDTEGRITDANDAFLRMSGYSRGDVESGRLRWDHMTPPEWMEASLRAMEEFKSEGYTTPYEKEYLRKDGSRWWALFAGTRLSENEGVEFLIDITDRKQAEQALKDADRRKDEFLATLAHELRNPLAPISNVIQLLLRSDGRRRADRLMEIVERQVNQIVRLVDDLLEVSRITSGKIRLKKAPAPLNDVVHSAIETSRPLIEQAGHSLTVQLPEEPIILDADSTRLTQVLSNLLNNAAKYTNASGHIWLSARRDGNKATITVRDDGIGIPPDRLPQIFDLFAQVHGTERGGQGGLGVGLTMARYLVEMHGGTIEAYSAGPGLGSEFMVCLPLADRACLGTAVQPQSPQTISLSGLRILIADDNQDAADSLGLLLHTDGAEVQVVYDGRSALSALEVFHPHVLLLDLGMPGIDGYDVVRQMRQEMRFQTIRVAALTGWGQDADRHETRRCGFDIHLTKPVDLVALKAWLTRP